MARFYRSGSSVSSYYLRASLDALDASRARARIVTPFDVAITWRARGVGRHPRGASRSPSADLARADIRRGGTAAARRRCISAVRRAEPQKQNSSKPPSRQPCRNINRLCCWTSTNWRRFTVLLRRSDSLSRQCASRWRPSPGPSPDPATMHTGRCFARGYGIASARTAALWGQRWRSRRERGPGRTF